MAAKWIKVSRGIRYREHTERKHNKRADRYYTIYYSVKGKDYNEGVGWSSDGVKQETCEDILRILRVNHKNGNGAQSYRDLREENLEKEIENKEQKAKEAELTLNHIFENGYLQVQKVNGKKERTIKDEVSIFKNYISPFFKNMLIKKIDSVQMNKFLLFLNEAKGFTTNRPLSDATKRNILAVLSQIFTYAQSNIDESLQNPIRKIKKPRSDNQRVRFLSIDEANALLEELKKRSLPLHNICVLSLFTGMRAGEILKLTWQDINFDEKSIYIKDPKNKQSRHAFMTDEVYTVLHEMYLIRNDEKKIFLHNEISRTFERVIEKLELNKDIDDRRQKVCFHTLRHTFASWHAKAGTPIFTLSKLLGHSDIKMTMRYSHLCPTAEREATKALEGVLHSKQAKIIDFNKAQ